MGEGEVATKSGLMVGFGETHDELVDAFGETARGRRPILTVGQYLRPTERHLPVVRYWAPGGVRRARGRRRTTLGFEHVAAGPLVRSQLPRGRARQAGPAGHRPAGRRNR